MPFVRRKRGQVLVVHNRRSEEGKVQQLVLHTFASPDELRSTLARGAWAQWRETMAWNHPEYRWDWKRLRGRLGEQLESWEPKPSGAVKRRGRKLVRMAGELNDSLSLLSPARAADVPVIELLRQPLTDITRNTERLISTGAHQPLMQGPTVHLRPDHATPARKQEAEMLFDEGMERWWAGDRVAACRSYRKVLKVQLDHSDAHNHLGIVALDRGRLKDAEQHFDAAIRGATADLVIEHGQTPWGFLENRSYLRAIYNRALVFYRRRQYAEQVELLERLLFLNPKDNQGARHLIGEAYHRQGMIEDAIQVYKNALDEPGCCYGLALALEEYRESSQAGLALVRGFAANRYIPPLLLGETWEAASNQPWASQDGPEWAAEYIAHQGDTWRKSPDARELLHRWWTAGPVQDWLSEIDAIDSKLEGLSPGDDRSWLVSRKIGLLGEEQVRIVAFDVDPRATGQHHCDKPPFVATVDQVRITKCGDHALIEYADDDVGDVHLGLENVEAMSEAEILARHNELIEVQEQMRSDYVHVAVEIPPGHPQIEYHPESRQWTPRGDVLRAVISCDATNEPCLIIDGRELSLAELGRMLSTYEGWGARITFVPDDELHQQPLVEVRQPDGGDG
jgi:tetratricopeptide (TPR) repeat protein